MSDQRKRRVYLDFEIEVDDKQVLSVTQNVVGIGKAMKGDK